MLISSLNKLFLHPCFVWTLTYTVSWRNPAENTQLYRKKEADEKNEIQPSGVVRQTRQSRVISVWITFSIVLLFV